MRELEQAIRSVILRKRYKGDLIAQEINIENRLVEKILREPLEAGELLSEYCYYFYQRLGTYKEVAIKTKLDRRTVKKYIDQKRKSLSI